MSPEVSPILPAPRSRPRLSAPAVTRFDQFVGIDWSGAKGECLPGIVVAAASCGADAPELVPGPKRGLWSRPEIFNYLVALAQSGRPTLVGIDFAFAYPFCGGGYFPDAENSPQTPRELWELVDQFGKPGDFLHGGGIMKNEPWKAHYYTGNDKREDRFRKTERAAGGSPKPTFKYGIPGQVAPGSLAGMRMLHALKEQSDINVAVWPFGSLDDSPLVVVEIYPRFFFTRIGMPLTPKKKSGVNEALEKYESNGLPEDFDFCCSNRMEDERDAIVSAAALRRLSSDENLWKVPCEAKKEGWIFGVNPN